MEEWLTRRWKPRKPDAYGSQAGLTLFQKEGGVTCKLSDLLCSVDIREADPVVGWMCQDVSA